MQIDWLTVAAQIANFLVLVWLLQRFLYRPITDAMRDREAAIAARLTEARTARETAEAEAEALARERGELQDEREGLLSAARQESEALRRRLDEELRAEIDAERAAWRDQLAEERDALTRHVQREAGRAVLDATSRVLDDLAGAALADQVAAAFLARIDGLEDAARRRLVEAAAGADAARIETGPALDAATRTRITEALRDALRPDLPVDFAEAGDLPLGIRLNIGAQVVEWSAARHLQRLSQALDEALDEALDGGGEPAP